MEYKIGMLDCVKSRNSESFVVKTSSNNYMIDTGYSNAFESIRILHENTCNGINEVDYLIISHGDDDHCGGIRNIINYFIPNFIIFSPIQIYKHILLRNIDMISFKDNSIDSDLLSEILSSQKYKKFYRIVSKEKMRNKADSSYDLINQNNFEIDGLNLDIIEIENESNPYFDIVVAVSDIYIKDSVSKDIKDSVSKDIKDSVGKDIKDNIKRLIEKSICEFETYDTGQTVKIEQALDRFVKDITNSTITIDTDSEHDLNEFVNKIIKYKLVEYSQIHETINKENFIRFFKKNVLKKINNAMSLIVRINDALFTGDSEAQQIKNVVDILKDNSINIVKVPHHGSIRNHFPSLYTKFQPQICLFKLSSKTLGDHVIRYILDETNAKICNNMYYRKCINGIILEVNIRSNKHNKCEVIQPNYSNRTEIVATVLGLNIIKVSVK